MIKIVIPTDFSDNAWNALSYAAEMFSNDKCTFVLLNVFNATPSDVQAVAVNYYEPLSNASKKQLGVAFDKFKDLNHHAETIIETQSAYGDLAIILEEMNQSEFIDFIIMGTHGATGAKELFIGSNTASVISNTSCPVICVPENAKFSNFKKILFACDNNDYQDQSVLDPLISLAEKFIAEVLILILRNHKTEPVSARDAEKELHAAQILKEIPHDIFIRTDENIEDGIREYAKENQVDMITMVKRRHTFWESLFTSSNTRKMAFHTNIPLLVLSENN